jgi:hypothetical protein
MADVALRLTDSVMLISLAVCSAPTAKGRTAQGSPETELPESGRLAPETAEYGEFMCDGTR